MGKEATEDMFASINDEIFATTDVDKEALFASINDEMFAKLWIY